MGLHNFVYDYCEVTENLIKTIKPITISYCKAGMFGSGII